MLTLEERWQGEGVAAVLDAEDAEQEAVHDDHDTTPDEDGELLCLLIGNSRRLDGQCDGSKRQNAVCVAS